MVQRLRTGGSDQEPCAKTPPSVVACAKRHLVSNLFALGARVVVASRLTIVSPCGVRRECAPRKLLGATCGRRAPLPCFRLSCLGGTPLPLRMKLSIDKVQRGEKPPPAVKSGGEELFAIPPRIRADGGQGPRPRRDRDGRRAARRHHPAALKQDGMTERMSYGAIERTYEGRHQEFIRLPNRGFTG